jgi:F0F1-type ATP synthase epsilon subunit
MAKEIKQKEANILTESAGWFQKFNDSFAKSDKKTFKENLIGHFAVQ